MHGKNKLITQTIIESQIFSIRGVQVVIDRDLGEMYGVLTKRLNEQVKRNISRFPMAFRFRLTYNKKDEPVTICDQFENLKHSSSLPYTFTEQVVAMLSAILRSETAVKVSIQIMQAFVQMRKIISAHSSITITELIEKIGVSEKTVKRIIKQLREANKIYRIGSKKTGEWMIVG